MAKSPVPATVAAGSHWRYWPRRIVSLVGCLTRGKMQTAATPPGCAAVRLSERLVLLPAEEAHRQQEGEPGPNQEYRNLGNEGRYSRALIVDASECIIEGGQR